VKNEYDTQFTTSKIDDILEVFCYVFAAVTGRGMKIYAVPGKQKDLKKHATSKE
jgi:hypothetical protein